MAGRVLIVEDDPQIAALLRVALEDDGYAVEATADPDVALAALRGGHYAAAIVDQLQPGMNELEDAPREWIVQAGRLCPTIVTTARGWALHLSDVSRRSLADELGVVAILPKPFDVGWLLRCVASAAHRAGGARGAMLSA